MNTPQAYSPGPSLAPWEGKNIARVGGRKVKSLGLQSNRESLLIGKNCVRVNYHVRYDLYNKKCYNKFYI